MGKQFLSKQQRTKNFAGSRGRKLQVLVSGCGISSGIFTRLQKYTPREDLCGQRRQTNGQCMPCQFLKGRKGGRMWSGRRSTRTATNRKSGSISREIRIKLVLPLCCGSAVPAAPEGTIFWPTSSTDPRVFTTQYVQASIPRAK